MRAAPEDASFDAERLGAALRYLEAHSGRDGIDQLVIVHEGRVLWQGPEADSVHGVWSMTKSFVSTVLGLLAADGRCGLGTRAHALVPALAETYPDVTLGHLATMTSGYRAVGDDTLRADGYRHGPSETPFVPAPEPLFAPGAGYAYWDSAMNLFALALTRCAGEPLEDVFRRRIADPIGMQHWRWGTLGTVDGLTVNGGAGNQSAHLYLSALDAARFGYLFLNRGAWRGRQLVEADWIERATRVHVPVETPHFGYVAQGPGLYGLNWWTNGVEPEGTRKWPGAPADTYAASGYNNNDLFVLPSWDLVVVRLGLDQSDHHITDDEYGAFLRMLGEALGTAVP